MRRASVIALILALLALLAWLTMRGRSRDATAEEGTASPPVAVTVEPRAHLSPDEAQLEAVTPPPAEPMVAPASHSRGEATLAQMPDVLLDPRLVIDKSARTLQLFSDGVVVKTYEVALGSSPQGDKEREGDGRTPEGTFYICTKNPKSQHTRALGLSYPSMRHAEAGLENGLITKRQFRTVTEALRHYERPPWNTPLGGEIMIHGGGVQEDWTQGCIALDDADAVELYDALPMGTPVDIVR